jgi:hypothetical protein
MSSSSRPPTAVTISVAGCVRRKRKAAARATVEQATRAAIGPPLSLRRRRKKRRSPVSLTAFFSPSFSLFFSLSLCCFNPRFSLHHFHRRYRLGRKIGSGSFGDIYLGKKVERTKQKESTTVAATTTTDSKQAKEKKKTMVLSFFFTFLPSPRCWFSSDTRMTCRDTSLYVLHWSVRPKMQGFPLNEL